jgi:cytochrome P450
MNDYIPTDHNGNLGSKEEYADLFLSLMGIAGMIGTGTLLVNVLTGDIIPDDLVIDVNNEREVMLAVLEAARISAPVNIVNVILQVEKTMIINGKESKLPAGVVVAASIGLAMHDPDIFPQPDMFNHKRENVVSANLNFNSVGFHPTGSGTRQCPGRNIAMKVASDVFVLSRTSQ